MNGCSINDDIVIYGHDKDGQDHNQTLEKDLQHAAEEGVKFNPYKCIFKYTQIQPLGLLLSKKGIKLHLKRVQTWQELYASQSHKKLQSFYGGQLSSSIQP